MCKMSIIIPVFNAEQSLQVCLDSLMAQTYDSFEVILINDGSSDSSGAICDQAAEQDHRFRVIHQHNSGPSAARNVGLDLAQGEIIAFVDSDDSVEPDYVICILRAFEQNKNAQIAFMGYQDLNAAKEVQSVKIPSVGFNDIIRAADELAVQDMFGYTWVKAFRRSVIRDLRFDESISLFEDEIFTCAALKRCTEICMIPKAIYHYVRGNSGALMSKTRDNFCQLQDSVFQAWKDLTPDTPEYKDILVRRANSMVEICQFYYFERPIQKKYFLSTLKESVFFQCSQKNTTFSKLLENNDLAALKRMRVKYRYRVAISKLLHR